MARMRAPERRRQLLEVAAEQFALTGYRGTTTAQLAEVAGITEPILYRHFSGKLDLFVTLIEEVGAEVVEAWREAMHRVKTPEDRLRVLLAGNPATHERGRGIYRVIFHAMTESDQDEAIADALRRHLLMLHRFLRDQLRTLQREGVVRDDESATALAWMLMDVAAGFGVLAPLDLPGRARKGRTDVQRMLAQFIAPA